MGAGADLAEAATPIERKIPCHAPICVEPDRPKAGIQGPLPGEAQQHTTNAPSLEPRVYGNAVDQEMVRPSLDDANRTRPVRRLEQPDLTADDPRPVVFRGGLGNGADRKSTSLKSSQQCAPRMPSAPSRNTEQSPHNK